MPIQILSPQLANQIAAGEVVERPSSVVKELLENSLDAGATKIEIDIEKGGSQRIRIRDNGSGIDKAELHLALSRHATSKVCEIADLEAIASLGFRGEALASISSVSRLTLTSKTAEQTEAWQAQAEGRDMQVEVKPAAHPIGTTIDVVDLFFNTPARRRFLRTDKTEFNHIEEVVKRIALSRFDVQIKLSHNGKMVKHFRSASDDAGQLKRIATVCGNQFTEHVLLLDCEYDLVKIRGWLGEPQVARQQRDIQYCYVNGRMMRDKLVNHAIRQAYESRISTEQHAAYVLFIEVDPKQVDVNVHPAKHEVRFHQARLIHDYIYQAIHSALNQQLVELSENLHNQNDFSFDQETGECFSKDDHQVHLYSGQQAPSLFEREIAEAPANGYQPSFRSQSHSSASNSSVTPSVHSQIEHYSELVSPVKNTEPLAELAKVKSATTFSEQDADNAVLSLLPPSQILFKHQQKLFMLSQSAFLQMMLQAKLKFTWSEPAAKAQPLLLPVAIKVDQALLNQFQLAQGLLSGLNFTVSIPTPNTLVIQKVPAIFRETNLAKVIPNWLQSLDKADVDGQEYPEAAMNKLISVSLSSQEELTWQDVISEVKDYNQISEQDFCYHAAQFATELPYQRFI
ncbi:DNA mismatch repair endonuclease MutL [Catenovulum sp. SM1970]|uniref:DNA mismatch repair endonuclease MutL n=1 Tax=Marinifaba aquimaris TaxID=2741323 RepID=UPI001572160D|nr:DNA mismatch repair endonuclease MutL [Marinifaba aquimaris]NTS77471.1 DNA mismatch repair endonuclease MutL [Marinifaba aquimaris]